MNLLSDEEAMLNFRLKLLRAEITMNAYKAENEICVAYGDIPKHDEAAFMKLLDQFDIIRPRIPSTKS